MNDELVEVLHRKLRAGGELFFQSDVFDLALDAMAVLEDASDRFANVGGPWSFARDNQYGAKSLREVRCEDTRHAHLAHVLPSRRCVERSSSPRASARSVRARHAYDQKVHALSSSRSSRLRRARAVGEPGRRGADAAAVKALRERIWHAGAEARDPELKRRFLARWPRLEAFDAWAMKRLFALNPEKKIAGFDEDVALPAGDVGARRLRGGVAAARRRLAQSRALSPRRSARARCTTRWARPLPDDPATLEMGGLDRAVEPGARALWPARTWRSATSRRCSRPIRAASPFRRRCTPSAPTSPRATPLLAALAARLPGGQRLALTHAGAAAHHIEDVANQIHTVQVGIYEFFVDAKIESIKEELASVGGLLRERPGFVSIGIDIIANHHVLAEALYAKHLARSQRSDRRAHARARWRRLRRRRPARLCDRLRPRHRREADRPSRATKGRRCTRPSAPSPIAASRAPACTSATTTIPTRRSSPTSTSHRFFDLEVTGARRGLAALGDWWAQLHRAAAGSTTPPSARSRRSSCTRASTRSTPPKDARASTRRSRPKRTNATGGSRSAM